MKPAKPIILHGFKKSGHSHRAELMLRLLGLPFDFREIDLAGGEHKRGAFLKLNPFGTVPVIDDSGTTVADSVAILVYLVIWRPSMMRRVVGYRPIPQRRRRCSAGSRSRKVRSSMALAPRGWSRFSTRHWITSAPNGSRRISLACSMRNLSVGAFWSRTLRRLPMSRSIVISRMRQRAASRLKLMGRYAAGWRASSGFPASRGCQKLERGLLRELTAKPTASTGCFQARHLQVKS